MTKKPVNFARVNSAALPCLRSLCERWMPDGKLTGREFQARNPTRADNRPGSFSINIANGRWCDFATGDRGGDPVSLAAYLFGMTQAEAAEELAQAVGVKARDH